MWLQSTGKLIYTPNKPGAIKRNNKWWLVVEVDRSIINYYAYWINRQIIKPPWLVKGLILQTPQWGGHITVLDGRVDVAKEYQHLWEKYADESITYEYSVEIEKHWKFWVLPVRCNRLNDIREELGLKRDYNFHVTIGRDAE